MFDTTKKRTVQQLANAFARYCGYGVATGIEINDYFEEPFIKERVRPGYRKNTTGEYVCNSYRSNFGWKNTYYQSAETVVALPLAMAQRCTDAEDWFNNDINV